MPNNYETAREMLDAIDSFLCRGDEEAANLWNVLTALRGPGGKKNAACKDAVTGVIRANAFPRTAFLGINERPSRAVFTLRRLCDFTGVKKGHFRFHCVKACEALGIETKGI